MLDMKLPDVEERNTEFKDTVSFAYQFLVADRDHMRSCEEEDERLFEELLGAAQHTPEECAKARIYRQDVLSAARRMLEVSDFRRGDDPAACDPGGGMRSPDDRDDDGPY
jgi:hypothetical protein